MSSEISLLIGLIMFYSVIWILASFSHHSKGKLRQKVDAPLWLRNCFGSFREDGSLDVLGASMQITSLFMIIWGLILYLTSGLNGETTGLLIQVGILLNGFIAIVASKIFRTNNNR